MKLTYSTTTIEIDNPDFGYSTDIEMSLSSSRVGTGNINHYDEGFNLDTYRCVRCRCVMDSTDMEAFFNLYSTVGRGEELTLTETASTGFFPFSPALDEGDGFKVYLVNVQNKGAFDTMGKRFSVQFDLLLAYTIETKPAYIGIRSDCVEGSLTLGENALEITGIRFPRRGFVLSKDHNVFPHITNGGTVYGSEYGTGSEANDTTMSIICTEKTVGNILYRLLHNWRANAFQMSVPAKYYPFGLDLGDNAQFMVKLLSGKIRVRHTKFNEFEIVLNVNLEEVI